MRTEGGLRGLTVGPLVPLGELLLQRVSEERKRSGLRGE